MEVATTELPIIDPSDFSVAGLFEVEYLQPSASSQADDIRFDLGLWLSGLESFLNAGNHSFVDRDRAKTTRDWTKEFRLTHSTLLLCAKLNFRLLKSLTDGDQMRSAKSFDGLNKNASELTAEELHEFSLALKDTVLLSESLIRAEPLRLGEWKAWCNILSERLKSMPAFDKLIAAAEKAGESHLPQVLVDLLQSRPIPFSEKADLQQILPRFAKILKCLSVVGRMLKDDEPLKPTLLIFSRVHELTHEMVNHINNRLSRFPNEDAELFRSLDSASYTTSIELRKVYDQELSGLVGIRPSLSIYARVETAYALLSDSLQQILVGFARLIDPAIETNALFPNFKLKLERSLTLRKDLWGVIECVQAAEQNPEGKPREALNKRLEEFLQESVHYLFYKDKETVERFVEEIFVTRDKKDLVPILHRFGAYLETLFSQINNRTVLEGHPFDIPEKK